MPEIQTLSERETEILLLIASGKSNKEVAHELQISANTVKVHVRNIFGKLEVSSRTEASMVALREGLINAGPLLEEPFTEDDADADQAEVEDVIEADAASPDSAVNQDVEAPPETDAVQQQPVPFPDSMPRIPGLQTGLIAGFIVIVVLLTAIAVRLYNSEPPPTPSEAAESVEQVAVESRWEDQPNLPEPRSRAAGVAFENKLYVISGLTGAAVSGDVLRFDPETGMWISLAVKPTPVSDVQAAVLGGKIYVPGGVQESGELSRALEIYDPLTDSWEIGVEMPEAISAYALAAYEGKLYLFGGWDGSGFSNQVLRYNPDTESWSEHTPMPLAVGYAGATVAGGQIYVIGGFDGEQPLATNFVYYPSLDGISPWKTSTAIPEGRYAMGLVSIADRIHLIGGKDDEGDVFSQMDFIPQNESWQIFENPLAGEWAHFSYAVIGSEIFVFGGEINGSQTDRSLSYSALYIVVIPVIR